MQQYLSEGLIIVGILLITIEVLLFNFATIVILFIGAGVFLTGIALSLNLVAMDRYWVIGYILVSTCVFAILFWIPVRRLRKRKTIQPRIEIELLGKQFVLDADVNMASNLDYRHSDISWKVRSIQPLLKGTLVKVTKVEAGMLWVSSIEK